jgi:hypothetical protein
VADRVEDLLETYIAQRLSQNRSGAEISRLLRREVSKPWAGRSIHEIGKRDVVEIVSAIEQRGALAAANKTLLIITKKAGASLAMDLAHSRPHKYYDRAPAKPFRTFATAVTRVIENSVHKTRSLRGPEPRLDEGDARCIPLSSSSVDLVLHLRLILMR